MDTVYGVFTSGWGRFDYPVLRQLFHNEVDANSYAQELREMEETSWDGFTMVKSYYSVEVEELDVQ